MRALVRRGASCEDTEVLADPRRDTLADPSRSPTPHSRDDGGPPSSGDETLDAPEPSRGAELQRGDAVDRYVVLHRLGKGGMGVVYAAHDSDLDRKVALKLVLPRPDAGAQPQLRLMREAQALARLSHPNIVAVHDVGRLGDRVWIAMELVDGAPLSHWLAQAQRRWREVLAVFLQAAEGLSAAHSAGFVHRDFKPANVMVCRDGRVRVVDFGLVRVEAGREPAADVAARPTALDLTLTHVGSLLGTPRYMAPEQWRGGLIDARTDQFAFAVALWEALHGEPPFVGESAAELAVHVPAGRRRPVPRGRQVPGWLRRTLERSLLVNPDLRWPSMAALLEALRRGGARARRRGLGLALAGAAALGGLAEGARRWDLAARAEACEAAGAAIEAVWNDGARERLRAAFVATGLPFAETTAVHVAPWLDHLAAGWRAAQTEACRSRVVDGTWDAALFDRAQRCLAERRVALETLLGEFDRADAGVVERAIRAATELAPAAACSDPERLRAAPEPPPAGREATREIRDLLARADALLLAGKADASLALAGQALARARGLGWPPLVAEARRQEGEALRAAGKWARAAEALAGAYFEASRHGAWAIAADAAVSLVSVVGANLERPGEGQTWARLAEVAIAHAGDPEGLREAYRLRGLADVDTTTGDFAEARAQYERVLALQEAAVGPDHPALLPTLRGLSRVHMELDALAEAEAAYRRHVAIVEEVSGPDHPQLAAAYGAFALFYNLRGRRDEAKPLYERSLAATEKAYGPEHPNLAKALTALGCNLLGLGEYERAKALLERALVVGERAFAPEHSFLAATLDCLGGVHEARAEDEQAGELYARALAMRERALGPDHPDVATSIYAVASAREALGDLEEAHRLFARALAIRRQRLGPNHRNVASSLARLAGVEVDLGRPREALALLDEAQPIFAALPDDPWDRDVAHFARARALWALGEREAALVEANRARDGFRAAGPFWQRELARAEAWIAAHSRGG